MACSDPAAVAQRNSPTPNYSCWSGPTAGKGRRGYGCLTSGDPAAGDPLLPALPGRRCADRIHRPRAGIRGRRKPRCARGDHATLLQDGIVVVCPPRANDESMPDEAQLEIGTHTHAAGRRRGRDRVTRMGVQEPRLDGVTRGAAQFDAGESVATDRPTRGIPHGC